MVAADDAALLSRTLILHGAEMARSYNGVFSDFFSAPRVRTIFNNIEDLDHLSESGLAVGGSWADRLYETCPFPLQPGRDLQVQSFRRITLEAELSLYTSSPWLAWVAALDLICTGTWSGLNAELIMSMVRALGQKVHLPVEQPHLANEVLGHRVALPMLSRGLQGLVLGVFTDVPKPEMEPIITSLLQFGELLSDIYADLRWKEFIDALEAELDEDALAREFINVVSPVAKVIVSREGRRAGYRIGNEGSYWSGYEALRGTDFDVTPTEQSFSVAGPGGAEIYIEPLTDIPNLSPEFTRIRLENFLNQALGSISTTQSTNPLGFADIRQLRTELEPYTEDEKASMAKLRQFFVVQKIEKFWHKGAVRVTNNEMKSFLESLGRDAKNGYQVTSYAADLEKLFNGKVTATKTRNALSLAWSKGA